MPADIGNDRSALQAGFLFILPRIELHARISFRSVKCPDKQQDYVQEACSLAWKWFVRLTQRGKDPTGFVSVIANYAVRAVKSGRRVCGQEKAKDAMSPLAQQRHGFTVESLPPSTSRSHEQLYSTPHGQRLMDAVEERLRDNT